MNNTTKAQSGSPTRDRFKTLHKRMMPAEMWALDNDLELVEKKPIPFIVARLDFKLCTDTISFSEAIAYQQLISTPMPYRIPVFIIRSASNFKDEDSEPSEHLFDVFELTSLNYRPDPPTWEGKQVVKNATWQDLMVWERKLRSSRKMEVHEYLKDSKP